MPTPVVPTPFIICVVLSKLHNLPVPLLSSLEEDNSGINFTRLLLGLNEFIYAKHLASCLAAGST